ncbi:MAG: ATP-binding protein [Verrucomicrobiota bacterium]|nr:ATP-binding protein [Verrucomicrobiota bacterium]
MQKEIAQLRKRVAELEKEAKSRHATQESLRGTEQKLLDANTRLSNALVQIKKSQQQMIQYERLIALCQMARGISHEMNNALMPILGFSDLLIHNPELLDNRQDAQEIFADINAAALRATDIIRRLREFYRASDDTERYSILDMNKIIENTLQLVEPRWKELEAKGRRIQVRKEFEPLPPVNGSESHLRDALMHLLLNAIDAMPQGGTITFRSRPGGDWIRIEVQDTGAGMTEEVRRRCFEPFFTTKGPSGTGMGLSLVYGTLRRHGGTVDIKSVPGQGTRVAIRLPQAQKVPERVEPTPEVAIPSLRVLIVDDDPWSRSVTQAYLKNRGHTAETTETGARGVEKFRSGAYDLVIVDRAMPDMSGDQVAGVVAEIRPGMPVIMLTGFGEVMLDDGECPAGVSLVIGKPVAEQGLLSGIARVWARRIASPPPGNTGVV